MDKPKEPGYSAISSTEISSEEGNVPPGRDEVGEDIDGLDLLPLVVDEPALDVGGEVLVQVIRKASLFLGVREKRLGRNRPPQNGGIGGSVALSGGW